MDYKNYKELFRVHKVAIILAVLVSLIAAFPQAYFRIDHANDGIYQGIELLPNGPWQGRVREVLDGHGFGSIYYKDGKSDPYLFQPLGSMTTAYIGQAFGLSINNTFLLATLVLSFITFLLLYGFVFVFSRDKLAALAIATVLLPAQPVLNLSSLARLLLGVVPADFWEMSQAANPAMIYIGFFAFLLLFWQYYQKRTWPWGVASAVVLGLNFYNYFYTATFLYAFGGILGAIFLLQKKWPEARAVFYVFLGGLLVAVPYVLNLYQATLHPNYHAVAARFAIMHNYAPLFIGVSVTIALIIFLVWFPREKKGHYAFGLALLLAPILTMNQQLITGKVLQVGHYHWYYHRPVAIIFAIITVFYLLDRYGWHRGKRALAVAMILASLVIVSWVQIQAYYHDPHVNDTIATERQKYGPVVEWLNVNAQKEGVVFANNEISDITVIYTPLNVFYHRSALHALSATLERLRDQLFTFYRLQGVDAEEARAVFEKDRAEVSTRLYGLYYRDLYESTGDIPQEKLDEIIALYEQSLATPLVAWLKQMMAKYEVSYALWDRTSDPTWELSKYPFLEEAATFGDITIYRVSP